MKPCFNDGVIKTTQTKGLVFRKPSFAGLKILFHNLCDIQTRFFQRAAIKWSIEDAFWMQDILWELILSFYLHIQ